MPETPMCGKMTADHTLAPCRLPARHMEPCDFRPRALTPSETAGPPLPEPLQMLVDALEASPEVRMVFHADPSPVSPSPAVGPTPQQPVQEQD